MARRPLDDRTPQQIDAALLRAAAAESRREREFEARRFAYGRPFIEFADEAAVIPLADNWYWARLDSDAALAQESQSLGFVVRRSSPVARWSLRNAALGQSHALVNVVPSRLPMGPPAAGSCYGPRGGVVDHDHDGRLALLREKLGIHPLDAAAEERKMALIRALRDSRITPVDSSVSP